MLPWTTLLIWSTICRFFISLSWFIILMRITSCLTFSMFCFLRLKSYFCTGLAFFKIYFWSRFRRRVLMRNRGSAKCSSVAADWLRAQLWFSFCDPTLSPPPMLETSQSQPEHTSKVCRMYIRFFVSLPLGCLPVSIAAIHFLVRSPKREHAHIHPVLYQSSTYVSWMP